MGHKNLARLLGKAYSSSGALRMRLMLGALSCMLARKQRVLVSDVPLAMAGGVVRPVLLLLMSPATITCPYCAALRGARAYTSFCFSSRVAWRSASSVQTAGK
jgi:hypothetical protein